MVRHNTCLFFSKKIFNDQISAPDATYFLSFYAFFFYFYPKLKSRKKNGEFRSLGQVFRNAKYLL